MSVDTPSADTDKTYEEHLADARANYAAPMRGGEMEGQIFAEELALLQHLYDKNAAMLDPLLEQAEPLLRERDAIVAGIEAIEDEMEKRGL